MTKAQLLIVADDFTGGLDTGVQFAKRGVPVRVVVKPQGAWTETDAQVLVAVSETRHLPPADAYAAVSRLVREARAAGIPYVYKKTDSALRGNIGAELNAAWTASGAETLAFLPAFPLMRRTTVGGRHYIDGVPVSRSPFGRDPLNPVAEDDVKVLIAAQTDAPVWNAVPEDIRAGRGICVVDAATDDDLARAGEALREQGLLRVTAGCAGFAAFLPALLGLKTGEPPRLPDLGDGLTVICGSANPITRRQLDWAETHGFARARFAPEKKLEPDRAAAPQLPGKWRILDANDEDMDNRPTREYASAHGWDMDDIRARVTASLAEMLAQMEPETTGALLITGGDTLLACMERLGGLGLEPVLELFPGVILARAVGGERERWVIAKSGGFGEETLLTDLREMIAGTNGAR